ncbi:unnamed protein product [Chironomus riparius]|uniref:Ionotropic receptor n=1 Tax=Chironomus riparius TaxID=315576 RepID=A0A9N9WQP1_9DIPT|nr:unnamed protein product [Chironomus riparius]
MKVTVILAVNCFAYLSIALLNPEQAISKMSIKDSIREWEWLSNYLATSMIKSKIMKDNGKLEVAIFLLNQPHQNQLYEGFQSSFSKFSKENIVISSMSFPKLRRDLRADFVLILTTPDPLDYKHLVENGFKVIFTSKQTRFIIIIRAWYNWNKILRSFWVQMNLNKYLNVYIALEMDFGIFDIYYTSYVMRNQIALAKVDSQSVSEKFVTIRDTINVAITPSFKILTYDSFPTSFIENFKIKGVDGYLIDEFVKQLNTSYTNVHTGNKNPTVSMLLSYLSTSVDICLCAQYNIESKNLESVWLNEIDGVCLLAPRIIQVSSYDNFTVGIDQPTVVLAIASAILVLICWKIISIHSEHRLSTLAMMFAIAKLALFSGVDGLNRMNLKEKLLLFSFIFASFFLHNIYEGSVLSFMMRDPSVRSASDIEELNNSDTKFYSYYYDETSSSKFPQIRKDLIMNIFDPEGSVSLNLPNDFDENLVYMVTCGFAENFVKSSKNFLNNRRQFDTIKITQSYRRFTIRNGFIFSDEFSRLAALSLESGIRSYWTMETYRLSGGFSNAVNYRNDLGRTFIKFEDLAFPLIVFLVGISVASFEFIAEIVKNHFMLLQLRRLMVAPKPTIQVNKTAPNLQKWIIKYIKKDSRCLKITKELKSNEDISKILKNKKRDIMKNAKFQEGKLKGGYLVPKRLKQRRIIGVIPKQSDTNETKI